MKLRWVFSLLFLDLPFDRPPGVCRCCKTPAPFTQVKCEGCGNRLPWADGVADELGEACPFCEKFNVYTRRRCSSCDELLPWHECVAAVYHATHDAPAEMRSLLWRVLFAAVAVMLALVGFVLLSPTR